MVTLDEKQAELDALQTAFDEYIVSSRDLEEELDAELTKCRKFLLYKWIAMAINKDKTHYFSHDTSYAQKMTSLKPNLATWP